MTGKTTEETASARRIPGPGLGEIAAAAAAAAAGLAAIEDDFETAVRIVVDTLRSGGKVLAAGNGGSAAEAMHLAEELSGLGVSKGTIRVPYDQPLPAELIERIAKWCYEKYAI